MSLLTYTADQPVLHVRCLNSTLTHYTYDLDVGEGDDA
jgi:hypothetical protein